MPKQKQTKKAAAKQKTATPTESDSTYFLKLVLVVLLGTFWLKFVEPLTIGGIFLSGIPIGLLAGLIIVSKFEHFETDRKIWYAILVVVTVVSYFVPAGIVL